MKSKLFCISYAGGSANCYAIWNKYLSKDIDLIPIELAGRGKRMGEPFYDSWESLAKDIYKKIVDNINDGDNYAIYGHSMGSWITYEVVKRIYKNNINKPYELFFSANSPPHLEPKEEKISSLPDDDFAKKIYDMGDTPKEILSGELKNFFLPILRSDYKLVESYPHKKENIIFDCPIHVLYGTKDNLDYDDLIQWKKYAGSDFYINSFDGGHMFFKEKSLETVNYLNSTMLKGE